MNIFAVLGIIASVAVLYLMFYWFPHKESQLIGYYKEAKLFGRVYAYFAVGGIFAIIGVIINAVLSIAGGGDNIVAEAIIPLVLGVPAGLAWSFFMYYRVAKKVPDYMRKRVIIDLTLCGLGIACKVALFIFMFFFKTWWEFAKPEEYTIEKTGQTVMVFPDGNVYDSSTSRFGKLTDDGNAVIWN